MAPVTLDPWYSCSHVVPSTLNRADLCNQGKACKEGSLLDVLRTFKQPYWEVHMVKNQGLLPKVHHLRSGSSSLGQTCRCRSPGSSLACKLIGVLKPGPLMFTAPNSWPTMTMWDDCSLFLEATDFKTLGTHSLSIYYLGWFHNHPIWSRKNRYKHLHFTDESVQAQRDEVTAWITLLIRDADTWPRTLIIWFLFGDIFCHSLLLLISQSSFYPLTQSNEPLVQLQ